MDDRVVIFHGLGQGHDLLNIAANHAESGIITMFLVMPLAARGKVIVQSYCGY